MTLSKQLPTMLLQKRALAERKGKTVSERAMMMHLGKSKTEMNPVQRIL